MHVYMYNAGRHGGCEARREFAPVRVAVERRQRGGVNENIT